MGGERTGGESKRDLSACCKCYIIPENSADAMRHGRTNRGERCNFAKISDRQARMALVLAGRGINATTIALSLGVAPRLIDRVLARETFRHISTIAA